MKEKKEKKAWLNYEEIIAKAYTAIYRVLEPDYTVKHNDFILGNKSETKRQIDISIKGKNEDNKDFLIIVSAKDYRSKISIPKIDELWGAMLDVNATKGILLCNGGFTAQTKIYARNLGIDLCTLRHLEDIQKEKIITIPIIFVHYEKVKFQTKYRIVADEGIVNKGEEAFKFRTYADANDFYDDIVLIFQSRWNNNQLDKTIGKHEITIDPFYVVVDGYKSLQDPCLIRYEVAKKGKIEFVPLEEYYQLSHQTKDEATEFFKISSEVSLNPKNWLRLPNIDTIEGSFPGLHLVFAFNEVLNKDNLTELNSTLEELN